LKRGEIWTVAGAKDYAGKPRPAVILQSDRFDATKSITICVATSDPSEAPLFRILVIPSARNGLNTDSRLMVDKITTVPKNKLGQRIGELEADDMARVNQGILIFLGLAG
jgi:mRNA interferase MazF